MRLPSPPLGFQRGRDNNNRRHHFSLSAFATESPDDSGPTRCCSMRSSPANPDAPDRTHRAPIGCRHRSASPHSSHRAPKVVLGAKKTETAISGKGPPSSKIRNRCDFFFSGGSPFQSSVSPFRFEKLVLPSPSFNHRHTNELPLPSQHTVPRRGNIGGSGGDCTGGGHGSFYPLHGGREAALTRLAFFVCGFSPRPLPFLAPPS